MRDEGLRREIDGWKNIICSCRCCPFPQVLPPLIFPNRGQKIMLVTESPYNYPSYKKKVRDPVDFINKELKPFFDKSKSTSTTSHELEPENIFDFIVKTFNVLDVDEFLDKVYWTHVVKKSLKCIDLFGFSESQAADSCFHSLIKEINILQPKIIVIATRLATCKLFDKGLKECFYRQCESIGEKDRLPTYRELISSKVQDKLRYKDVKVAIFPNPSPRNNKWKKELYSRQKCIMKVINMIRSAL